MPPKPQSSEALKTNTSTSARLQRSSRPLHLHVPRPAACLLSSGAPYLYASSTSPGPQHASRAPDLLRQTPPRLHDCNRPPELQSFIPLCLHVCTPAAHLQTSASPGPQHASEARELHTLRYHICTLAACRPTSIPPHFYTYSMPPELRSSIPLHHLRPYAGSAPTTITSSSSTRATSTSISNRSRITGKSWIVGRSWIGGRSWITGKKELDRGQELGDGQELGSEPTFHHYHFGPRCAGRSRASTSLHLHVYTPAAYLQSS